MTAAAAPPTALGQLPAGRYRFEVHRLGPLAAVASLEHTCYVLHATPYLQRQAARSLAVPAGSAGTDLVGDWHLLLVLAIPVEEA